LLVHMINVVLLSSAHVRPIQGTTVGDKMFAAVYDKVPALRAPSNARKIGVKQAVPPTKHSPSPSGGGSPSRRDC